MKTSTTTTVFQQLADNTDDGNRSNNPENPENTINGLVSIMKRIGKQHFADNKSVSEIQRSLAQLGIDYLSSSSLKSSSSSSSHTASSDDNDDDVDNDYIYYASQFQKVSGCIATVHVQTTLLIPKKNIAPEQLGRTTGAPKVFVTGTSDAHISRGLLSLLSESICGEGEEDQTTTVSVVDDILSIEPTNISKYLQIQSALSVGRNDGLSNMMKTIQYQLKDLLLLVEQQSQSRQQESGDGDNNTLDDVQQLVADAKKEQEEDLEESSRPLTQHAVIGDGSSPQKDKKQPTAALLLSGGVDSSVALHLLLEQGYNVTAFYLKIWLEDELAHLGTCPWQEDIEICQQVCSQANVPLISVSLQKQYHERVMSHTLHEAAKGRTPSPDILCNSRIKFGTFLDMMEERYNNDNSEWYDVIASGHYAQVRYNSTTNRYHLFRAPDPVKDQSYFLCALNQEQLSRLAFPIGNLEKSHVRDLANHKFQLPNRHRADSQGLCFLGKLKFNDFLNANLGAKPGPIVDALNGNVIGRHDGVWYHTVGQRKGLGPFLHPLATSQGPWYVVAKDPSQDVVYASNQYDEDIFEQTRSECYVEDIHWIAGHPPDDTTGSNEPLRLKMKIRHGPKLVSGTLELNAEDEHGDEGKVKLEGKDGGLAAGQYVVFYNDDAECLGGGIISERHWTEFLSSHGHEQAQITVPADASKLKVTGKRREATQRQAHPELRVVGLDDVRTTIRGSNGNAPGGVNETNASWRVEVKG